MEFTILGRPLRALGLSARLEAWLRSNWQFRHTTMFSSRFAIDVIARSHAPRSLHIISGVTQLCTLHGMTLAWRRIARRAWFCRARSGAVRFDLSGDRSRIDLWFDRADDVRPDLLAALHVALCESVRSSGLVPLHASVAARDGAAVAFTGQSGVGKSSTLVSLLARGWTPLAEDFAWLDPATRRVYGWDRGVHLTDQGRARLRRDVPAVGWRREQDKHFIEFDRFATAESFCANSAALVRLIELKRDDARDSSVGQLGPRDAVRALWESAGVPLCERSRNRFTVEVPALIRHLDIGQMVLGRTPIVL